MPGPNLKIAVKSTPSTFKAALNRLGSDAAFRADVIQNPSKLTDTFHLSLTELHALRQAAQLSGVDMTAINKVRATELGHFAGTHPQATDVNVSCCCCCCCGETSVVQGYA